MSDGAFVVRRATVADASGIARVHVESSENAYAPLAAEWDAPGVPERIADWTEWLTVAQGNAQRVDLVAGRDGEIVGFITMGRPRRKDLDVELEVYVIHVLPECRGGGVGGALWTRACEALRGDSRRAMYVETFAELRCCSFYAARGGEIVERKAATYHGGLVTELVYRWAPGQPNEPAPG